MKFIAYLWLIVGIIVFTFSMITTLPSEMYTPENAVGYMFGAAISAGIIFVLPSWLILRTKKKQVQSETVTKNEPTLT